MFAGRDAVNPQAGQDCAADVFAQAGVTSPREQIDCIEMYVPFSWYEPMWLENLGFVPEGDGWKMTEKGATALDGELPVNMSGGVLSTNPIGASGMLRFAEAAMQVRGQAGEHQVDGARTALGHAYGGGSQFFAMWVVGGGEALSERQYPERSWLSPLLEVRESRIEGRGLFATEQIEPGTLIAIMGGTVLTDDEFRALQLTKYSAAAIEEGLNILHPEETPLQYGNHSCDSNMWMDDEVTIAAAPRDPRGGRGDYRLRAVHGCSDLEDAMPLRRGLMPWGRDWRRLATPGDPKALSRPLLALHQPPDRPSVRFVEHTLRGVPQSTGGQSRFFAMWVVAAEKP